MVINLSSLPNIEEKVNTDRKKGWKPLIPENELLIQPESIIGGKVTSNTIQYTSNEHRHVTPPPQRKNYQTNSSRPLNRAQNVQSMGRFETNGSIEQDAKIKTLEGELAKMQIVVDNLQKEKELALKFNQLLLLKLDGVANEGVQAGSVVEVN